MPILTANIGTERRAVLDAFAKKEKLTNADTLRVVVVTGLGGSVKDWMALNAEMAEFRKAAEDRYGMKRNPGPREMGATGKTPSVVSVRLPKVWAKKVKDAGGFKDVVLAGLDKLAGID
jgi:hypothetical protein